jgi:hypothetical protein
MPAQTLLANTNQVFSPKLVTWRICPYSTLVQYLNIYYCILYMCTSYFVFCEHRLQITYTFSYSISNNPRYSIQTFPPRVTRYVVYYVHINSPPIKFRNWVRKKNNIKTFQPPILYLVLPCRTWQNYLPHICIIKLSLLIIFDLHNTFISCFYVRALYNMLYVLNYIIIIVIIYQ